jgi:hypothetical protein
MTFRRVLVNSVLDRPRAGIGGQHDPPYGFSATSFSAVPDG